MLTPKELILRPQPVSLSEFNLTSNPSRIIACLNPPVEAVRAGHAIALPAETFDIRAILKQLPADFQPDLVSLSARVMTFQPRRLHTLNCPTVMKLGDTFHLGDGGLSRMIQYCKQLNCDYHWTYQSAQHLHFFVEAGLKNVFWLPASIVLNQYIPPPSEQSYTVIFRGSKSELHCYRNYLLDKLQSVVDIQTKDYISTLEDYRKAQIVLNTSLNGDLNRRVFEVLMAGGFLLTDRIRPQTGLFELFKEGVHFECYGSETELSEKIEFYLAHPEHAAQIAAAGHQQFWQHYSPQVIQQKLYHYIFNHEIEAPFRLEHDRRSHSPSTLQTRLKLYELIQELHRLSPSLSILCDHLPAEIMADLADLSRSHLTDTVEEHSRYQLILLDGTRSLQSLQQQIQATIPDLQPLGFLIVINPRFITIQRLNQTCEQQNCFPCQLSVNLFEQRYDLQLDEHGLIYQKIPPRAYIKKEDCVADLTVQRISTKEILKQSLKSLPIVGALRPIRAFLRRHTRP